MVIKVVGGSAPQNEKGRNSSAWDLIASGTCASLVVNELTIASGILKGRRDS